ncbi:MAG: hypothetical protein ACP6IU_04515 [Candidatus Asgardarchaeia archaeon]|nr:MAG: hypothetical protein DRO67_08235 [Candidatus Asgardarchaeum californiense]
MPYKPRRVEKEKVTRSIHIDDEARQKIDNIIKKNKYITPQMIAQGAGLRVSVVKDLLEKMAQEGKLKLHASSARLKVYVPVK